MAKNKKSPKKKEGILDKITPPDNTIKASFSIASLAMSKELRWKLDLNIQKRLPKTYREYRMTLCFDEDPFNRRIADVEKKIKEIEADQNLFRNTKVMREEIEEQKDRITEIRKEMDQKKAECPKIEFLAEVDELKHRDAGTWVRLRIPDVVIPDLNDRKHWFSYYRAELKPTETIELDRGEED